MRERRAVQVEKGSIFGPDGARAFQRDLPDAEIHLLDTGHFALETHWSFGSGYGGNDEIAGHIREFLGRTQRQPMLAR